MKSDKISRLLKKKHAHTEPTNTINRNYTNLLHEIDLASGFVYDGEQLKLIVNNCHYHNDLDGRNKKKEKKNSND